MGEFFDQLNNYQLTKEHPNCSVRAFVAESNLCDTGNIRTYDPIDSLTAVANRAVVNRTLISHRYNVVNGGCVPETTFLTLNQCSASGVPPQGFRCAANLYKKLNIRTL
jgi:hypothetical protein